MMMSSRSLDRTRQFFSVRRDTASPASERPAVCRLAGRPPGWPGRLGGTVLVGGALLARGAELPGRAAPVARPAGWRCAAEGVRAGRAPGRPGAALRTCLTRDGTVSEPLTW